MRSLFALCALAALAGVCADPPETSLSNEPLVDVANVSDAASAAAASAEAAELARVERLMNENDLPSDLHLAEPSQGDEEEEEDGDGKAAELPPPVVRIGTAEAPLVDITPNDLYATLENTTFVLLFMQASWCSACKTVRKEYERAAQLAFSLKLPVLFARMDAQEYTDFAKDELGVERLPTFLFFRNHGSAQEDFPLLTTAEAFVAGAAKLIGSDLELTPAKVFDESPLDVATWIFFRGTPDGKLLSTLLFYEPPGLVGDAASAAAALYRTFDGAAKDLMRFSNLRFAICRKEDVLREFELPLDRATVVLYTDHDEGRFEYDGALNASELRSWMLVHDTPLVTDVWHRTMQGMRARVKTFALFFVREAHMDHYPSLQRVRAGLQEVALALVARGLVRRGEFTIGIADGEKYVDWMRAFALPTGRLPAAGIEMTTTKTLVGLDDFAVEASGGLPPGPDGAPYALSELASAADRQALADLEAQASATPATVAVAADGDIAISTDVPHVAPAADRLPWVRVPVSELIESFSHHLRRFAARSALNAALGGAESGSKPTSDSAPPQDSSASPAPSPA